MKNFAGQDPQDCDNLRLRMPTPEERARQIIDALLGQCGCNFGRQALAAWSAL
jgi:hypothetical protein